MDTKASPHFPDQMIPVPPAVERYASRTSKDSSSSSYSARVIAVVVTPPGRPDAVS
jgi:hypothetical protein